MRAAILAALVACNATTATIAPDATRPTVTVVLRWSYFTSEFHCLAVPTCNPLACDGTACECGVSMPRGPLTLHCCVAVATIYSDDLGRLVTDYPTGALTMTSPATYQLGYDYQSSAPVYWVDPFAWALDSGMPLPYTAENACGWQLPYAVAP